MTIMMHKENLHNFEKKFKKMHKDDTTIPYSTLMKNNPGISETLQNKNRWYISNDAKKKSLRISKYDELLNVYNRKNAI